MYFIVYLATDIYNESRLEFAKFETSEKAIDFINTNNMKPQSYHIFKGEKATLTIK